MLKALRNFIIGLLIGAVVFTLVLPYAYFHESPGKFYADLVNGQLRQRQNTIQLARYFDDGGTHLPILNYRTFVDADAEGNPVTPGITLAQFEWQMQTLIDIGCRMYLNCKISLLFYSLLISVTITQASGNVNLAPDSQ